mgnify:CR=1 FL=1
MVRKLVQTMNGYSALVAKVLFAVALSGIILWTFCIVRDLPQLLTDYVTKVELRTLLCDMKADQDKQMDRVFREMSSINDFLRGRRFVQNLNGGHDVGSAKSE